MNGRRDSVKTLLRNVTINLELSNESAAGNVCTAQSLGISLVTEVSFILMR